MTNPILDAFYSLGKKINKALGDDTTAEVQEGVVSEKFPELKLDMSNEDLGDLADKWEKEWIESPQYAEWILKGEDNEDYWLGKHFTKPKVDKTRNLVDNVIFEALETYLPQVTQHNPDAVVTLASQESQTPENLAFATQLKLKLGELADELKVRLKLKKVARHWAIYLLGVVKLGWDMDYDIPTGKVLRPKKIILDPNATIDEDGYTGNRIGEHRKLEANLMIQMLDAIGGEEGYKKLLEEATTKDNTPHLGTEIGFIEWWTPMYMCWTLKGKVLLKKKNPHWNYPQEVPVQQDPNLPMQQPEAGQPVMPQLSEGEEAPEGGQPEEGGEPAEAPTQTVPGHNHFPVPKMPFIFLTVFNLGKQPMDDTSLISQNLASQDLVNKRLKQIDKNADSMNGGMVVSLERAGMTMQQAKGVTEALRKGGTVAIPAGDVNEAIARMSAPALPPDVYLQLQDTRSRVAYIFGTKGFQANSGGSSKNAVRQQIINQNLDQARIAGGFSEYLEQMADEFYNWCVQLLYVYDDNYANKPHPKVYISIKEGSLLPKDTASKLAQAKELVSVGKMSLLDYYKTAEYPNAEEMAANVWLEANAPEILFQGDPRIQQALQMKAQAAAQGEKDKPSTSINFKDLPPEGKAQLAKQADIDLHPEGIAAHDEHVDQRSKQPVEQPADQEQPTPTQ